MGMTITEIHDITKIDNWFLQRIFMMHTHAVAMQKMQLEQFDYDFFMEAKCLGFSGASIIQCPYKSERLTHDAWSAFRNHKETLGSVPESHCCFATVSHATPLQVLTGRIPASKSLTNLGRLGHFNFLFPGPRNSSPVSWSGWVVGCTHNALLGAFFFLVVN